MPGRRPPGHREPPLHQRILGRRGPGLLRVRPDDEPSARRHRHTQQMPHQVRAPPLGQPPPGQSRQLPDDLQPVDLQPEPVLRPHRAPSPTAPRRLRREIRRPDELRDRRMPPGLIGLPGRQRSVDRGHFPAGPSAAPARRQRHFAPGGFTAAGRPGAA
ncbi:hypothetical protein T261_03239 [Streptomyces lydicus]|nr:hypothetical protein T261_03239 [Streptomyces lydicus]